MPRVSAAFFVTGALLLLSGMILGEYMGANENFTLSPLHAHINLLGWVTLALYGTFYTLTKDTYSPRLAWINFVLSSVGVLVMIPILALLLTQPNGPATYGPWAGAAGGIALLGLLVFLVSAVRELMRRRA
jgi:drug/metabolite transporter (DMT)-like permease